MKKVLHWIDDYLEEVLLVAALAAMAVIMGVQVFWGRLCRGRRN